MDAMSAPSGCRERIDGGGHTVWARRVRAIGRMPCPGTNDAAESGYGSGLRAMTRVQRTEERGDAIERVVEDRK
jgi:hypothetical protein